MTKAELRQRFRFLLDSAGTGYFPTTAPGAYDVDEMLSDAYREVAKRLKAFPMAYTAAAVPDAAVYAFSYFGAHPEDLDAVSLADAADDTDPFSLDAQPDVARPLAITLTNNTGGPGNGNTADYQVAGVGMGYAPLSETVSFTAAELAGIADGASVTHSTAARFASITSITPSAAQPAFWLHSAGFRADAPGARIFDLAQVMFDGTPIARRNTSDLDAYDYLWRTRGSSTSDVWLPEGAVGIRLWPPPASALDIYVEGWETPDPLTFASDTHEPQLHETDQELITLWACILATVRNPNDEMAVRGSWFGARFEELLRKSYTRIHNSGGEIIQYSKHSRGVRQRYPIGAEGITNIP